MSAGEFRVLTYNVHGLRDDRGAVVRLVRSARPDVVCFQEAPRRTLWRQRCSGLARDADLLYVTGGRPAAGNMLAVAARVDVLGARDALLSPTPRWERRGVTSALLRLGGVPFGVVGMHAGLSSVERTRHAAEILTVVDRLHGAGAVGVVVAGDLNAATDRPEWRHLSARFADAYAVAPTGAKLTFSSARPAHRIDVVFAEPPIEVVSCGGLDHPDVVRASDHRPVLAVLRLPGLPLP